MFGNVNYSKKYIRGDVVRALDSRKAGARNVQVRNQRIRMQQIDTHTNHRQSTVPDTRKCSTNWHRFSQTKIRIILWSDKCVSTYLSKARAKSIRATKALDSCDQRSSLSLQMQMRVYRHPQQQSHKWPDETHSGILVCTTISRYSCISCEYDNQLLLVTQ